MLEALWRDCRFAVRALRRSPGFTATAVLTLGLGIGATTAVFSVVYGTVFRPLPFPNASRLVQVVQLFPNPDDPADPSRRGLSPEQIRAAQGSTQTLTGIGYAIPFAYDATLTGTGTPVRLAGTSVSASLFQALGVQPIRGRLYEEEEPAVVLLSYESWRRYFGNDDAVVGRIVTLNEQPTRIVGVMPRDFGFPSIAQPDALTSSGTPADTPEFWRPLALRPTRGSSVMMATTYALLREGYTAPQAAAELSSILPPYPFPRFPRSGVDVVNLRDETARTVRPILLAFQAGVALVFLVACINIVHLLRARGAQRRPELWIRTALGASRGHILRHAVAESLLLSLAGGALGVLLAYALTGAVRLLPPHVLPRLAQISVDATVLGFAFVISATAGVTVGLFAASRAGGRAIPSPGRATQERRSDVLLVAEIAAAVVLLVTGGLLLNSSVRLATTPMGFDGRGVLAFGVAVPLSRYPTSDAQEALYDHFTTAWRRLPGVASVAMGTDGNVLGPSSIGWPLVIGGRTIEDNITFRHVSAGFFETLGVPVVAGREFSTTDPAEAPRTVIVNASFARRYYGGVNITGERIGFDTHKGLEIVGVVADVRAAPGAPTEPIIYFPVRAIVGSAGVVGLVRASGDPLALVDAIRRIVAERDPGLVVYDVQTMDAMLARSTITSRFYAAVSSAFAVAASLLAALGLYGVLMHSVARRTREFGVRTALGAQRRTLIAGVMRRGVLVALCGTAAGVWAAVPASRVIETLLFDVTRLDLVTFTAVTLLFLLVAAVACYVPSRRATSVDPAVALRAE